MPRICDIQAMIHYNDILGLQDVRRIGDDYSKAVSITSIRWLRKVFSHKMLFRRLDQQLKGVVKEEHVRLPKVD